MLELVGNLLKAFDTSIDGLEWMSPETRAEAKKKLSKITVKIGYPDKWRDYSALTVRSDDLVGNLLRAAEFQHNRFVTRTGGPVDKGEWLMTPQTVNAYYNSATNEITFPAAILRWPFFDMTADPAVNYGGIGSVIGHEISHGFDDSGRQFDGDGNLRDWWTADDGAKFKQRAAELVKQFAGYSVLDSRHLNGELTLGENIGDLSGMAVAFKAYKLSLGGASRRRRSTVSPATSASSSAGRRSGGATTATRSCSSAWSPIRTARASFVRMVRQATSTLSTMRLA